MERYTDLDQRIHQLAQTIAKANRTFVPKAEDDSHTNLYFDSMGQRIFGRWINTSKGKVILTLNLIENRFKWLNDSFDTVQHFDAVGKTQDQVEHEIAVSMADFPLDGEGFLKPLHYEIPKYEFVGNTMKAMEGDALDEWMDIRTLANQACLLVTGYLQMNAEIRIWPHHFDTGFYGQVNEQLGLGFGLAMEDTLVGSPYFYMSGYVNGGMSYNDPPDLGIAEWIVSKHYAGAVLRVDKLSKDKTDRQTQLEVYIKSALEMFMTRSLA